MRGGSVLLLLALVVACGRTEVPATDPVATVSPAPLRAGEPVPTPSGRAVLELEVAGRSVPFDLATLRRMGLVELRVFEPWVKKDLTFHGVWLTDVLAVAGAPAGSSVRITALDDYVVELPAADLEGVLLVTSDGAGRDLAVADGGPTRIVFRAGARAGENADRWIWSLRTIDVR